MCPKQSASRDDTFPSYLTRLKYIGGWDISWIKTAFMLHTVNYRKNCLVVRLLD